MNLEDIKKLRKQTGAGVMDTKKALEDANGDLQKAKEVLKAKGLERAEKKSEREIKAGRVFSYIHGVGKVGAIIKIGCETDFVAQNEEFEKLGNEIAMQVAAMNPESIEELLKQDYIRDSSKTIKDLLSEVISKTGENTTIAEISRLSI
ncbi:translation elongation factor Ts [candidate division WWE3 bacterium CG_4_9_14_0_2_um_filter_35_11]|uniref:Elongation factor Ts n=1 Tax=candidate division WWE3 bacterium CG_4_9_14_0_2_um_filter_35_11 TaxID=1975077 RepID=A0A2M8EM61_UNCKA|nr:MAG: translation elongation factor Ts [candidate division WWE3 bacterium CG10_big_fil_rev_8_21_14_0_10_35_32]PJC23819.1 MAG: translation elongation factor Ts [candidate division WWE3 bacterium CG_4_9_14_0_2_um_filter_35_11]